MLRALCTFFAIGCALFGVKRALGAYASGPLPLRVHARAGASAAELAQASERALLAELGLRRTAPLRDPVIRERLAATLLEPGAHADSAALQRQAQELGLWHEDTLIEARLAAAAELRLRAALPQAQPSDAELVAYRDAHSERYRSAERVSFVHIFLSGAQRGRAEALRAQLQAGGTGPERADAYTEPSNLPRRVSAASLQSVAGRFGPEFAAALARVEPGSWSAPLASAFGVHLVWLSERLPAAVLELAQARARLSADYREERARSELTRQLAALRADYELQVVR